jgi:hypothetical protein
MGFDGGRIQLAGSTEDKQCYLLAYFEDERLAADAEIFPARSR